MATANLSTPDKPALASRSPFWLFLDRLPGVTFLKNLNIGRKLTLGFGLLVLLTLLGVLFSYIGSSQATTTIDRTGEVRVPTALAASLAQADLLRMLGDARGYLALGEPGLRLDYNGSRQAFEADLAELARLSPDLGPENNRRLEELKATYASWLPVTDRLFELRNDQLEREPAYRVLATEGLRVGGLVLLDTQQLINIQAQQSPGPDSIGILTDLAGFQASFAGMISGLRGYVTTGNRDFRVEYRSNLAANKIAWERLNLQADMMTPEQQTLLSNITANRNAFLELPDEMFTIMAGDRYREDLYLFRTEALPLIKTMQDLLNEMTYDQQSRLKTELTEGRLDLSQANQQILLGGVLSILTGVALAIIFRENIAGPVRRLTGVAERIRGGDLEAQALAEAGDEIGTLAVTFNNMTGQLRQTLRQVRKEKRRADDLLEVVIPIGVALSSEKDFNRLLENMLFEAKNFCHADAGILYLLTEAKRLKFVIVRNDTLNIMMGGTADKDVTFSRLPELLPVYDDEMNQKLKRQTIAAQAAATGQSINIPDAYQEDVLNLYGVGVFDEKTSYRSISYLTIPLKNNHGEVIGVLQLINAQDPESRQVIPFDPNLQQMMESFSSLAVAALEAYRREQGLRQQIQQLRIEIDEVKRQKQVEEITGTDFFADLQAKATSYRSRRRQREETPSDEEKPDEDNQPQ